MEVTMLIINIVGLLMGGLGFLVALLALVIALWQVRSARRVSKLEGDIIALEAFLTVELAGKKEKELIKKLLELIFLKVEQLGSSEILEMKDIFERQFFDKRSMQ